MQLFIYTHTLSNRLSIQYDSVATKYVKLIKEAPDKKNAQNRTHLRRDYVKIFAGTLAMSRPASLK